MDHLLLQDLPECPAGEDIWVQVRVTGRHGLPFLHVFEHCPVLVGRVIDPDREHPVHDLVIAYALYLRKPPDATGRDGADPHLPVGGDSPVLDRLPKTGSGSLQDLLQVVGERDIIKEKDGPWPELVMVVEGLVRDCALHPELFGKEREHGVAGMGLALPGVPGDRDMQPSGIGHRLRGNRHD